jgi:hypothetical protein
MKTYGCQSMFAPVRRMLLKHPRQAFVDQSHIDALQKRPDQRTHDGLSTQREAGRKSYSSRLINQNGLLSKPVLVD